MNAAGVFTVMRPDGTTASAEPGTVGLSGLLDVVGPFVSGELPNYGASTFTAGSAGGTGVILTIVSSGQIEVIDLLYSGVIAAGMANQNFTWSGIDQTYESLEIRGIARGSTASTTVGFGVWFNGDTTATNYLSRRSYGTGSASQDAYDSNYVGQIQGGSSTLASHGITSPVHIWIPDYAKAGTRKYLYTYGSPASNSASTSLDIYLFSAQWENTSGPAINMLQMICNTADTFVSGTELYVYGHKKIWAITSGIYGTAGIVNGRFV